MNFFLDIVRSTERFQSIIAPHENQNSYVSANNGKFSLLFVFICIHF